jgi:hypothetical protein
VSSVSCPVGLEAAEATTNYCLKFHFVPFPPSALLKTVYPSESSPLDSRKSAFDGSPSCFEAIIKSPSSSTSTGLACFAGAAFLAFLVSFLPSDLSFYLAFAIIGSLFYSSSSEESIVITKEAIINTIFSFFIIYYF